MAQNVEPMDVDSEFDNKENTYQHSNVLPCTEKGYEELDVSELNMKLRYSVTPAASPMSKSCITPADKTFDIDTLNGNEANLSRSLNSKINKSDVIKSFKSLLLQTLPSEQFIDGNGNPTISRQIENTNANIIIVTEPNDIDENLSLPSTSSSELQTPATTPTKDIKSDGSPIMRGLKSVLNMFRGSQSPVPPGESEGPAVVSENLKPQAVASTPIATHKNKEGNSRKNSPLKESIKFNDDLEKELNWEDETDVIFSYEKIPVHKLFLMPSIKTKENEEKEAQNTAAALPENLNTTVEYMDVSYCEPVTDKTMTDVQTGKNDVTVGAESDSEFLDCETTFNKTHNDLDNNNAEGNTASASVIIQPNILEIPPALNENSSNAINDTIQIDNITFTDCDKNNMSLPSDYSNYSKETNDILSELDKLEASVSPKSNTSQVNKTHDNKLLDKLHTNESITTTLNVQNDIVDDTLNISEIKDQICETIESTDNENSSQGSQEEMKLNVTSTIPQQEGNITQAIESPADILNKETNQENEQGNNELNLTNEVNEQECNVNVTEPITSTEIINLNIDIRQENNETENMLDITKEITDKEFTLHNGSENFTLPKEIQQQTDQFLETSNRNESDNPTELPLPNDEFCTEIIAQPIIPISSSQDVTESINLVEDQDVPINKELSKDINVPEADSIIAQDALTEAILEIGKPADVPLPDDEKGKDNLEIIVDTSPLTPPIIQEVPTIQTQLENSELLKCNATDAVSEIVSSQQVDNIETVNVNIISEVNVDATDEVSVKTEDASKSSVVTHLDVNEVNKEQDKLLQPQNDLPEVVLICKTNDLEAFELNQHEVNNSYKALDVTISKDSSEYANNENKNVEPMDITMNKSLITTDLPDIVNQSITVPEENVIKTEAAMPETPISPIEVEMKMDDTENAKKENVCTDNTDIVNTTPCLTLSNKQENVETVVNVTETTPADKIIKNDVQTAVMENDQITSAIAGAVDEEIILSENNSPYVSLMAGLGRTSEEIEQNFEHGEIANTSTNIPSSPPIKSRGYNFNFDDMDDPFNTKHKISMSPPLSNSKPENEDKKICNPKKLTNRRKSQPVDKKNSTALNKKLNATFDPQLTPNNPMKEDEVNLKIVKPKLSVADYIKETSQVAQEEEHLNASTKQNKYIANAHNEHVGEDIDKQFESNEENKTSIDSITSVSNDANAQSLEQSTYYSAGTSSTDSYKTKNVFNLPEIDDMNFNPFASKPKVRQSPQRDIDAENPFATKTKILNSPDYSMIVPPRDDLNKKVTVPEAQTINQEKVESADKMETELMEKQSSANVTSTPAPFSENISPRETNTEDEDTEEGPFLEAEDLIDKMSDFEDGNVDMMQFNEIPAQDPDGNDGELFIDAEAYEFLLNKNQCNIVAESGKESLFLKFDPLFANRISSDGILSALNKVQRKQSTPTKPARLSLKNDTSPIAGPSSTLNATYEYDNNVSQETNDDLNITVAKPMMVVTPAVNPAVTPRTKSTTTPTRSNRHSITFTSPAIAVIDRLLSMSSNNSFMGQDTTTAQPSREQNEADLALTQLRELLAEKEISVYNLRYETKELQDRLSTMENQVKILEADGQERLKKINELNERLAEKTRINKSMAAVVEEYERTIASLIAETEQDKKRHAEERMRLINERDEQTAHLASMEVSFSDLHSKYEKSKQIILACKANEDVYKKTIKDLEENLNKAQSNYELLKQHATSKLNHANQELEKMNRSHEAEVVKFNALIKRKELHITSLEETLAQKTKANDELTAICDELINKV